MKKKWYRYFIIIFAGITLTVGILSVTISHKIEKRIRELSIGAFQVEIRKVKTSLIDGNIILQELLLTDTLGKGFIAVPEVTCEGIHLISFIFQRKITIDSIRVKQANIALHSGIDKGPKLNHKSEQPSKFNQLEIGRLRIINGHLLVDNLSSLANDSIFTTEFNFDLWGISANKEKKHIYGQTSFDSLNFSLKEGMYKLPNKLYRINYQTIIYNSNKNKINIDLVLVKSEHPKYEIGKLTGAETAWLDLKVQDINAENIRLDNLLIDNALVLSQVKIKDFSGMVFKDKRLPFTKKSDTELPMEFFNSLPFACHIDSITLENGDIDYSQRVDKSSNEGIVSFNELNAQIKNLSNIDSLITAPTTMYASTKVMNKAILTADFVFPNLKYPGLYHAKGQMGPVKIDVFNPMLKHTAFVNVESGDIKHLAFNFQYNNERSDGNLYLEYQNLAISIFDPSDNKTNKLKSILVNTIVLHEENLKDNNSFRDGTISFERDKKRAIFNFWWKSLLSGIKSTLIL